MAREYCDTFKRHAHGEQVDERTEAKIRERKQQAIDKDLFVKTKLIAEKFGTRDPEASYHGYDGSSTVLVLKDAATGLVARYTYDHIPKCPGFSGANDHMVEISSKDKPVFRAHADGFGSGITRYIPGPWEAQVEALFATAQQEIKNEQAEARKEAARERAKATRRAAVQRKADAKARRDNFGL